MNAHVSATRTNSNPVTIAAMIKVNGLEAVLRSGRVPAGLALSVYREQTDSRPKAFTAERRKFICEARGRGEVFRALRFARRYGVDCIRAADAKPFALRLLGGMVDCWHSGFDRARMGREHGYDVALRLARLDREQLTYEALRLGLDLRLLDVGDAVEGSQTFGAVSRRVLGRICPLFGVTVKELKSSSREQRHVLPRSMYFYWTYRLGKAAGNRVSFPALGRRMGGRDHTTALHGVRTWPQKRKAARRMLKELRASV